MLAKYSPFKRKNCSPELVDFVARAENTPAFAPPPATPRLPERSNAGDFSSAGNSPHKSARSLRAQSQSQEKDSLSTVVDFASLDEGLPLRPFLTAQGQELERAKVKMEGMMHQLDMERKVKKSEMKLAQERQGNIAAMIGLALVHRNQLQAELSRAAVEQAEQQAAAAAREAEEEKKNILTSTAWWIESKMEKMKQKHAKELLRANGKIKHLQSKLGATQRENIELIQALAAAREDRVHHQGDLLALQKSFDARLSELSAKVSPHHGGDSALDAGAIDAFGEILEEEAQGLQSQTRQLMVAKAAMEEQSLLARTAASKLTNALSATRDLHEIPERVKAWQSLERLSEHRVLGMDDVRLWMQRLEEVHVVANIVKEGDARRSSNLEYQVEMLRERCEVMAADNRKKIKSMKNMILRGPQQVPQEIDCHAVSETSSSSMGGSDRGKSDAIEGEFNFHANTIGARHTEKEIRDLKEQAERVAPLEAQVEVLEQILLTMAKDKDDRVSELQNELSLVLTWVAELENEYALLEHDYRYMESLMPDEALQKMKAALLESGRLREGSAMMAQNDHSEGGSPYVPSLADLNQLDRLSSSIPQGKVTSFRKLRSTLSTMITGTSPKKPEVSYHHKSMSPHKAAGESSGQGSPEPSTSALPKMSRDSNSHETGSYDQQALDRRIELALQKIYAKEQQLSCKLTDISGDGLCLGKSDEDSLVPEE